MLLPVAITLCALSWRGTSRRYPARGHLFVRVRAPRPPSPQVGPFARVRYLNGEKLVQFRGWSGSTRLCMQRQLEERGCKRPLRSKSNEAALPVQPGGAQQAWQRRGLARAGGGRRRLQRASGRQPQAQTRPGGTSCRGQARGKFACACAGQLCAQQRLAGSLCRGAVCRPEKEG